MDNTFAPNSDFSILSKDSKSGSPITPPLDNLGLPSGSDHSYSQAIGSEVDLSLFAPPGLNDQTVQRDAIAHPSTLPIPPQSQDKSGRNRSDSLTGDAPAVADVDEKAPAINKRAKRKLDLQGVKFNKDLLVDIGKIKDLTINPNFFSQFSITDASGDNSAKTVFEDGVLRLNYSWFNTSNLDEVRIEAVQGGSVVANLGTWSSSSRSNQLINLANFSSIDDGTYKLQAVAETTGGSVYTSSATKIRVLPWSVKYGTIGPDTLAYSGAPKTGAVFLGRGGTDTLDLASFSQADVKSINGVSLGSFNPYFSTANQAIFQGSSFDYLTLSNGREIYFQGIENLEFSDGSRVELQVHPNDTYFNDQWNLRVSDVESAWRFTRGSSGILIASLDTGILTAVGGTGGISDIANYRLITDPSDDDNFKDYGHGHSAMSVMGSTANNSSGVAGINWYSKMYVNDVYSGVNLQTAIKDTINYAKANNMKVVFQGGIQGEGWLTSGGSQAQLESLISANSDIALFAVAAGNGGPGGNLNDPNYLTSVSGVAKLQTNYSNVISVGALAKTGTTYVNGLANASSVDIAGYSNRGSNLTLMAATNSPAMDKNGDMRFFGGTSCANPNMAAIASLVWSVNPYFSGGQVRQLLIDTAMDLGSYGKDNTFGNGLVNADAAVRRAAALKEDYQLASLYSSKRWQPSIFSVLDDFKVLTKDIKFIVDPKFTHILDTNIQTIKKPSVDLEFDSMDSFAIAPVASGFDASEGSDRPSIFDALIAPNSNFLDDMVDENSWSESLAEEFALV